MKTYIGTPKQINKEFISDVMSKVIHKDKKYVVEVKELKGCKNEEQRSRYWIMVRQYAKAVKVGQSEIHNIQLAELGILQKDIQGSYITELHKPDYNWQKDYYNHLKPTGTIIKDNKGNELRVFYRLKNSEDFTTEEYSRLIDTIINNIIQDGLDNVIDVNYVGR